MFCLIVSLLAYVSDAKIIFHFKFVLRAYFFCTVQVLIYAAAVVVVVVVAVWNIV